MGILEKVFFYKFKIFLSSLLFGNSDNILNIRLKVFVFCGVYFLLMLKNWLKIFFRMLLLMFVVVSSFSDVVVKLGKE